MALDYLGNVKFGSEPPQFPADSNGFEGFFSGWAAGSALREERLQGKEDAKTESDKGQIGPLNENRHFDNSKVRPPGTPSFMDSLAKSFLGAKGEAAAGADPLFEVKKLTLEQSAKMKALEIGESLQRRQNMLESRGAMLDFGEMITDALQQPDPAAAYGQISGFMARHPALFETDEGKGMWKQYEGALDRIDKNRMHRELMQRYKDQYGPDRYVPPTTKARDIENLDLAKKELVAAQASGDPTRIASAQTKVDGFTAAVFPGGTTLTNFDPVTGKPTTTVQIGGRPSTAQPVDPSVPTATNLSALQKSVRSGMDTVAAVDDLLPRIRSDSVGILGNMSELVLDRLLPQFGMNTADPERMDTRTRIRAFAADSVKQLNQPDPRMSDADRAILKEIPPDAKDWNLSSPKAISDLATIRRLAAKNTIRDLGQMKQPAPPVLFDPLSYTDIQEIYKQGFLDYDTAFRELLKKPAPTP